MPSSHRVRQQAAYIFDPDEAEDQDHQQQRPSKKRRVGSKRRSSAKSAGAWESSQQAQTTFVPLLNGAERPEFVQLREKLYEESWAKIDARIQVSDCSSPLGRIFESKQASRTP